MIALLGWHPGQTQQEIFTLDEMVDQFSIEHVGKSGARFDFEKAKWFNHEYIKQLDNATLASAFAPILARHHNGAVSDAKLERIVGALKERCTFMPQFWEFGQYFFTDPADYDKDVVSKKWNARAKPVFEQLTQEWKSLQDDTPTAIERFILGFVKNNGLQNGDVLPLLRIMLSGTKNGPAVYEIASILGNAASVQRLERFFERHPV